MTQNDPKQSAVLSEVRNTTSQTKDIQSKSLSDAPKIDFKTPSRSQDYKLSSNPNKAQNNLNFITIPSGNVAWLRLSNLSEDEKIEIIKTGFQLQADNKISLKNYYESKNTNSLFQLKGYSIKYETVRRTKLYQSLKA